MALQYKTDLLRRSVMLTDRKVSQITFGMLYNNIMFSLKKLLKLPEKELHKHYISRKKVLKEQVSK